MLSAHCIGEGPPLVLLHGLFGDKKNLGVAARAMAARFSCHSLDLPNHGDSPRLPNMRFEAMLPPLEQYIAALPAPVSILGHSLGGKLAMLFACRHPRRTKHLIVVDIAPAQNKNRMTNILRSLAAVNLEKLENREQAERQLAGGIADAATRQFLLKSLQRGEDGAWRWRFNLESICANPGQWLANSLTDNDVYDAPCHFIHGEKSDYVNPAAPQAIYRHFPQARVISIANAGHWVHAEQPKVFLATIEKILD